MTYAPCADCHRHPEVSRRTGGRVDLWHACNGHQIGYTLDSEERAIAWWAGSYGAERDPAVPWRAAFEARRHEDALG